MLQNLCLDKVYSTLFIEDAAEEVGYVTHIRRIGEGKKDRLLSCKAYESRMNFVMDAEVPCHSEPI